MHKQRDADAQTHTFIMVHTCHDDTMTRRIIMHRWTPTILLAMVISGGLFLASRPFSRNIRDCTVAAFSFFLFPKSCYAFASPPPTNHRFGATTLQMSTATCASTLTVAQFPCLGDNYGYLIHDEATGQTAAIDTPCARTYQSELDKRGWKLTHIFNTHQ